MSRFRKRDRLIGSGHLATVVRKDYIGEIVKDHGLVAENSRRLVEKARYDPNDASYRLRLALASQRGYD